MRRFIVRIHWRSFRWKLSGMAESSTALLAGLLNHVPPDAIISIFRPERRDEQPRWLRELRQGARDG